MIHRSKLTKEMLLSHIENIRDTDTIMAAASKSEVSYPAFTARFRKAKLKINVVKDALSMGKTPDEIVNTVSARVFGPKVYKKKVKSKILDFKSVGRLLEKLSHDLLEQAS